MSTFPDQNKQTKAQFFRKLGYYACGIAIGFVLLGFLQRMRQVEAAKRADAAKEAEKKAAEQPSLFPPPPGTEAAKPDGAGVGK